MLLRLQSPIKKISIIFMSLSFSLVYIYTNSLLGHYRYMGWQPLENSFENYFFILPAFLFILWLFPYKLRLPSDWFLILYTLGVLYPNIFFVTVPAPLSIANKYFLFLILALPSITIKYSRRIRIDLPNLTFLTRTHTYALLVIFSLVGVTVLLFVGSSAFNLSWDQQYLRRLAARETFVSRSIPAYLSNMIINGVGPCMAFIGATSKRPLLIAIASFIAIVAFGVFGIKGSFLLTALSLFVGIQFRKKREGKLGNWILVLVFGFSLISIAEVYSGEEMLFITDTFIRRYFVVPAVLQSHYYDLLMHTDDAFLMGVPTAGYKSITFMIGNLYYLSETTNANSNSFIVALARYGSIGYLLNIILVTVIFAIIDTSYKKSQNVLAMYIALLFAQLITEQFITTALLSSGLALLMIMLIISSSPQKCKATYSIVKKRFTL